jgi:hypothetical protein
VAFPMEVDTDDNILEREAVVGRLGFKAQLGMNLPV